MRWVRSLTILQEKYRHCISGHWPQTEKRVHVSLEGSQQPCMSIWSAFLPGLSCKTKLPHVFRRMDREKDLRVSISIPRNQHYRKMLDSSAGLGWKIPCALGPCAKDLWVTWNLHVTCWTQSLERTNLLLIYVNRKLCSSICMFLSSTLYPLKILDFPRE